MNSKELLGLLSSDELAIEVSASRMHDALLARGWQHDTEESDLVLYYVLHLEASDASFVVRLRDAICLPPNDDERAPIESFVVFRRSTWDSEEIPPKEVPVDVIDRVAKDLTAALVG